MSNSPSSTIDLLPSWNPGITKERIVEFVRNVTDSEKTNYIPPEDRIAVFDNDGTLWGEKPTYFQGFFVVDRLEELSKSNPEIKRIPQFKQLMDRNFTNLQLSMKDIMSLVMLTHSNITQPEFQTMVEKWAKIAHHPQTNKRFVEMVYQPMIELISFLKHNQFRIFIVSAGGADLMRVALSKVYEIPQNQIIGSSIKYRYIDGTNGEISKIVREPELFSLNDKEVKPANIQLHIGKVPVFAVGNSDGDLQMLEYTDDNNNDGKSLEILVHHDDGVREYSYETGAENILKEARSRDWIIVSMEDDFRIIYPRHLNNN